MYKSSILKMGDLQKLIEFTREFYQEMNSFNSQIQLLLQKYTQKPFSYSCIKPLNLIKIFNQSPDLFQLESVTPNSATLDKKKNKFSFTQKKANVEQQLLDIQREIFRNIQDYSLYQCEEICMQTWEPIQLLQEEIQQCTIDFLLAGQQNFQFTQTNKGSSKQLFALSDIKQQNIQNVQINLDSTQ